MLARIGVKVELAGAAQGAIFRQGAEARRLPDLVLSVGLDAGLDRIRTTCCTTSWAAGTIDKDPTRGEANLGGYCNKELDALTDKILVETDTAKRDQLIKQAFEIGIKDYGYIPLHQQSLAWGVSKKVKMIQRADNQVLFYWATKQE